MEIARVGGASPVQTQTVRARAASVVAVDKLCLHDKQKREWALVRRGERPEGPGMAAGLLQSQRPAQQQTDIM
jgi:hypothetical protein